jgi:hypothetical protein
MRTRPATQKPYAFAERDAAIIHRYSEGESCAAIADSLGLTYDRIRQIVRQSGVPTPWEYKCAALGCDRARRSPDSYCVTHQRSFEALGVGPSLRDQHGTRACYAEAGCRCALCRKYIADRARRRAHQLHPAMEYYVPAENGTPRQTTKVLTGKRRTHLAD